MKQAFAIRTVWRLTLGPVFGFCGIDTAEYAPRSFDFCFAARGRRGGESGSMISSGLDAWLIAMVKVAIE